MPWFEYWIKLTLLCHLDQVFISCVLVSKGVLVLLICFFSHILVVRVFKLNYLTGVVYLYDLR